MKFSAVKLLNSGVVIYLRWPGILFSIAVRTLVVAKLLLLGVLFLISFIFALTLYLPGCARRLHQQWLTSRPIQLKPTDF